MKIIATNKRAYHNYEILETLQAGIVLKGDEIKSLRSKHISLTDAFATIHQGNLVLTNCHITPYKHAYTKEDTSRRPRTLLLHKREINRLVGAISRKGLTIVPLKVYLNERGYAKIELGVAKHKKAASKKQELKERDIRRETAREAKVRLD
jgi:SsrA-binding protein